jgi:hypothetical protein
MEQTEQEVVDAANAEAIRITREAIATSIDLLDREGPSGWRERINVDELEMDDQEMCVLGQIYGHFDIGLMQLRLHERQIEHAFTMPQACYEPLGKIYWTMSTQINAGYELLQEEWPRALTG